MRLPFFSGYHCVHCGFVDRASLSPTGKALATLWLLALVGGIVFWPLLLVWAAATVTIVLVFEKICCCPDCGEEVPPAVPKAHA